MKGFGIDPHQIKKNIEKTSSQRIQIINLAINLHSQGKIKEAKKYYQYCIDKGFNDHKIFSNFAIILQSEGKFKEAEISYRKVTQINPNLIEGHLNLGNILRILGKFKEAEISYRKVTQINPNLIEGHLNLGNILRILGKFKEAEISYRKAIQLNPNFAEAYLNLSNILRSQGKLKEAESSILKAIKLNPNFAEAHLNLGNILLELEDFHNAESSTQKAIRLNPNFAEAYLNLGNILQNLGNFKEAEISYRKAIQLNPKFTEAHLNLGKLLKNLGKLKEAESSILKAIQLNPNFPESHSTMGSILIGLGQFKEAELSLLKATELNPKLFKAYYSLSILNAPNQITKWKDKLFSEKIIKNSSQKDQINIYFARANILHKDKNYRESAKNLKQANELKVALTPSQSDELIEKSKNLFIETKKTRIYEKGKEKYPQSIFIVGMPRSGSTLIESILSMNSNVQDLEEINILEESFEEQSKHSKGSSLADLYWQKVKNNKKKLKTTTNKWLYNYQYSGIIASQIPNVKIIHSFRNPLDNILSIYRTHFTKRNKYSSSLIDCAKVYLDQEYIMNKYKAEFPSMIYNLDYDLLVNNPKREIKSLISFLGWTWDDIYLNPHLNKRSVTTASVVQVRSPINSNSIGSWKNYKKLLQPAIDLITQNEKYRNLAT